VTSHLYLVHIILAHTFLRFFIKTGTPIGVPVWDLAAAAAVVAAAVIVVVGSTAHAAVVAAAAEQNQQDDDPPDITAAEIIVAHKITSEFGF
jgi:hypothetical protein